MNTLIGQINIDSIPVTLDIQAPSVFDLSKQTYLLFHPPAHGDLVLFIPRQITYAIFLVELIPVFFCQVSLPTFRRPVIVVVIVVPEELMIVSDNINVAFIVACVSRKVGVSTPVVHHVVVDQLFMAVVAVESQEVDAVPNALV